MSENNSKKPDEGRLIDYLLNESSSEERVEIERLCGENPDWQEAKAELERTLGLIEDACKQPVTEIESEMELDPRRRQELESLRSGEPVEPGEQAEQEAETEERMLIFKPAVWVPLAVAACAALLVWAPGLMDEETPEQQLAAAGPEAKGGKNENSSATKTDQRTLQSGKPPLAKSDSVNANADPNAPFASKAARLKENQDKSEGTSLELEEDLTIALEKRALGGANEVLNGRSRRDVASLNDDLATLSLADAFARPRPSAETPDFALIHPATGTALPVPGSPLPIDPDEASPAPISPASSPGPARATPTVRIAGQSAGEGSLSDAPEELKKLVEDEKGLALRRVDSGDRLNRPQDLSAGFKIDTDRGRELSDKDSAKKRESNLFYFSADKKRSKPTSWTALVRKPGVCFLFNKEGQALGEVVVTQSEGKTSGIRRIGEIRQGKRFVLTPGQFELRFTDQSGSVVILSGDLKSGGNLFVDEVSEGKSKSSRDGDYEFEAKEAWWLDQNEVRQALPVNELAR